MSYDINAEVGQSALREALAAANADARHPALRLSLFVAEPLDDEDVLDNADTLDYLAESVPAEVRRDAECRRGALIEAAKQIINQCLDDLQELAFDDDGLPDPELAEATLVFHAFPARHRSAYTQRFFRDVLVVAVKVGNDLADPNGGPASCTAEEILRSHIGEEAIALCELAGLGPPGLHPDEILLEDTDFESLYDDTLDGVEDDPAHQARIGLEVAAVAEWFAPFRSDRIVHPYVRTEPSIVGQLHDLRLRLTGLAHDEYRAVDWTRVDDPAPIRGFGPISDVVELARQAARLDSTNDVWIADPDDPEESFGDLVRATTLSPEGSGWITWETHDGADTVRIDGVILATPHRHFPVGADEAYLDVSLGARLVSIPLSAVVSYRPDPEPHRRWEKAFPAPNG
jgi:hypothetical protein